MAQYSGNIELLAGASKDNKFDFDFQAQHPKFGVMSKAERLADSELRETLARALVNNGAAKLVEPKWYA